MTTVITFADFNNIGTELPFGAIGQYHHFIFFEKLHKNTRVITGEQNRQDFPSANTLTLMQLRTHTKTRFNYTHVDTERDRKANMQYMIIHCNVITGQDRIPETTDYNRNDVKINIKVIILTLAK